MTDNFYDGREHWKCPKCGLPFLLPKNAEKKCAFCKYDESQELTTTRSVNIVAGVEEPVQEINTQEK